MGICPADSKKKVIAVLFCVIFMSVLVVGIAVQSFLQYRKENHSVNLTIQYDDRYTFPDTIESVETLNVTSKKTGTDMLDTDVIRIKSSLEDNTCVASGVGSARVILKNGNVYDVTVTAAPISVFLIIGQSNAEGSTSGEAEVYTKARDQSIVCEEGQIYSTYAWSTKNHDTYVAGLFSSVYLTEETAKNFVAESLTSEKSRGGTVLEYPLNSLSEGGKGKVGFDSGFAWKWNQLTGEKVWVVNCGAGSTAMKVWQPDYVPPVGNTDPVEENHYKMCVELMKNVRQTMEAEIIAGHYVLKNFAYFWLQGETDALLGTTQDEYYEMLKVLHTSLKEDVKMTDNKMLEGCGIIKVRAFITREDPLTDTQATPPRLAQQIAIEASEGVFSDVFLACDVNDLWIMDTEVEKYWENAYPNSEYPFTVHAQAYTNPAKVAVVHNGTHYLQPGYNEIGIVVAQSALAQLRME